MKKICCVALLFVMLGGVLGCEMLSKNKFDITLAELHNIRNKSLGILMEFSQTMRGISADDHMNLTVTLYPRSGSSFKHVAKNIEGYKLENLMTINGAGRHIEPKDYQKFSIKIEQDGKIIAEQYVTLDEAGTNKLASKKEFEQYE
ncbi:MAG: hypothetical protein QGH40_02580 [bacterium]|nr:hypothetical protein [bacterium]